jgi:hypothetical protein
MYICTTAHIKSSNNPHRPTFCSLPYSSILLLVCLFLHIITHSSLLLQLRNSAQLCRHSIDTHYRKHITRDCYLLLCDVITHGQAARTQAKHCTSIVVWRHWPCASCMATEKTLLQYCWPCVCMCGWFLAMDIQITISTLKQKKKELRDFSLKANYTDRTIAGYWRS